MTMHQLTFYVANNIALIGMAAFLTTRLPAVRRTLTNSQYRLFDKIVLGVAFGFFSALGNWIGIPMMLGALANTRIVGPVAGGLIGGPLVGVIAGVLGAIPRYFMGGFTMWSAVISNIIAGYISGLVYQKYGGQRINLLIALMTGLVCEGILKILVLTISKPFEAALALEQVIGLPTMVGNTLAVGFFVYIVHGVINEQEKMLALSAQQTMRMIQKTSGFLQDGLNEITAGQVASIIHAETKAAAVALTDASKVLSFVGLGSDHHLIGASIITTATKMALASRQTVIVNNRKSIGCPHAECPLTAVVDAPLIVGQELVGSLKLYKTKNETITSYEAELIQGIADFLSLQLAHQKLDAQQRLLLQTEYNMLKAQINPHFFFNTLGTIQALVQSQPQEAGILIKDMADFFRRTLKRSGEFISIREEMETVHVYLRIEKARFGSRIQIAESVPEDLLDYPIPVFSLQPLVENAVRHGVSVKKGGGNISISARRKHDILSVLIADDGVGIESDRLQDLLNANGRGTSSEGIGIGLSNVHMRLQKIYGKAFGLQIHSQVGLGTEVSISLPCIRQEEAIYAQVDGTGC